MQYPWISKANNLFLSVLAAQFFVAIIIGLITQTTVLGLVAGLIILSLPVFLIQTNPYSFITRSSVAIAIQLMTALHIQQAMGLIEIHFEIFVVLAFLSVYRDWRVILISTLTVAVHHIGFFWLQSTSSSFFIFEQGHVSFYILLIHAAFAICEGGILMYIAKKAYIEMKGSYALGHTVELILKDRRYVDLTHKVDQEIESLAHFDKLITQFKGVIGQAKTVSDEVQLRINTVKNISEQVSLSSQQNAHSLSEIAEAINNMNTAVNSVAHSSEDANNIALTSKSESISAKQILESNNERVQQLQIDISSTSTTIQNLANRCNHIDEVMNAIKAVSEQTNLLALNAAIESARAGEHGRGFAVVADEVRKLATKTRENADEISRVAADLIHDANKSVEQMKRCIEEVENAGNVSLQAVDIIQSVVKGIEAVSSNIAQVARATDEQSNTSKAVTESTLQVTDAANIQQTMAAKAQQELLSLTVQITKLSDALSKFKL
ncbi:methyl-accepting chemotaxis sensory transducer [Pseudoalteromonas luteoviolacea B = ATCC 29581]|nr:methyl-accepting chemotaxis sensory transducer [Pseudoalteromonas luteoviolacea B = ATCC 29581]